MTAPESSEQQKSAGPAKLDCWRLPANISTHKDTFIRLRRCGQSRAVRTFRHLLSEAASLRSATKTRFEKHVDVRNVQGATKREDKKKCL